MLVLRIRTPHRRGAEIGVSKYSVKMHLLNVKTLSLEEFYDDSNDLPKYAIVSHRWGESEVSFQKISQASQAGKEGFRKIVESAYLAEQSGLSYIWIDTCCIDKSPSAELQDNINSMFSYYQRSEVCFAYPDDVKANSCVEDILRAKW